MKSRKESYLTPNRPALWRFDLELDFARSMNKVEPFSRSNTIPCKQFVMNVMFTSNTYISKNDLKSIQAHEVQHASLIEWLQNQTFTQERILTLSSYIAASADCWSTKTANANGWQHTIPWQNLAPHQNKVKINVYWISERTTRLYGQGYYRAKPHILVLTTHRCYILTTITPVWLKSG